MSLIAKSSNKHFKTMFSSRILIHSKAAYLISIDLSGITIKRSLKVLDGYFFVFVNNLFEKLFFRIRAIPSWRRLIF